MKWTDEQQAAIEAPKPGSLPSQTLLVAAAAGSGKTAVLVERIISRLKDKNDSLKIQDLLVVTFTKAAAAEMSARIGLKLAEECQQTDDEELRQELEEQLRLLPSAHISTLHSFCQWVIRSYFYQLDIDPSFRVGNEGEMSLLQADVLDEVFQKAYAENLHHIFDLADMFSDDRSDNALKKQVLSLYGFALAQASPTHWLEGIKQRYEAAQVQKVEETIWGQGLWQEQQETIAELVRSYEEVDRLVKDPAGPSDWLPMLEQMEPFLAALQAAKTWEDMHEAVMLLDGVEYKQLRATAAMKKGLADGSMSNAAVDRVKTILKANRDIQKAMPQGPFSLTLDEWQEQVKRQYPYVEGLVDMALAFMQAYGAKKKEEGLIDFSDLEHFCLALLTEPGTEANPQPSVVAKELRELFQEIMVDEYQDTNGVQEAIVNLVSRVDNRFYVGDVKQSIYRFRMADPSLFMAKYKSFGFGLEAVERRIDLAKNFRSDANILKATNFIFRQIMTEEGAELTYGDAEALYAGRQVEGAPENWVGGSVDIHLVKVDRGGNEDDSEGGSAGQYSRTSGNSSVDGEASDDEVSGEELANDEKEMQMIIEQIKNLKAAGAQVQDKDGSFRPMEWRDIVILLRSLAGRANRMVEAFRQAGIPAYAEENSGYFSALEVQLMISLLQVLDNPEQDLPMAAVLRSALVGLDGNELGRLRLSGTGSLWSLLPAFAEQEEHEGLQEFVRRFEHWRTLSRRRGVSELLWQIYEDTHYVEYVSAMSNGLVRKANVLALYDRAKQYEAGSFRGLFRFLRFLENLQESGQDLGIAKTVSESDDVVRIMSIHKSKGLEFPVVFLSGVQKKFNMQDMKQHMLLHAQSGMGIKGYYPEYRVLYPSLSWLYTRRLMELAMKAEEERILYVALTRAKDKLFITGYVEGFESKCKTKVAPALMSSDQTLPKSCIVGANSYLDWILLSLGRHIDGNAIRVAAEVEEVQMPALGDKDCRFQFILHESSEYTVADELLGTGEQIELREAVANLQPIAAEPLAEEVVNRFNYTYAYPKAVQTAAKISVSEIKKRFTTVEETMEEAELLVEDIDEWKVGSTIAATEQRAQRELIYQIEQGGSEHLESMRSDDSEEGDVIPLHSVFSQKPSALEEAASIEGATKGTLMHEVMQWLPLVDLVEDGETPCEAKKLRAALQRLVTLQRITEKEYKALYQPALQTFFSSSLAKRIKAVEEDSQGVVKREWPFSMLFPAKRVYPEVEDGEELFLQGILDMAFLEEGQWVLVDYKNDWVTSGDELIERYRIQLSLYKEALETLTGIPVKECLIYSFRLGEVIELGKEQT